MWVAITVRKRSQYTVLVLLYVCLVSTVVLLYQSYALSYYIIISFVCPCVTEYDHSGVLDTVYEFF